MSKKKIKYTGKRLRQRGSKRAQSNLPLIIAIGGVLLVGAALFAFWKSQQPASQSASIKVSGRPSLEVDRDFVDFGDVPLDQVISVDFELANVGDQPLQFTAKPYVEVVEGC
ncbi:MAG TPA: hypothetical protein VFZ76_09690 [Anaerolineales bacterium]